MSKAQTDAAITKVGNAPGTYWMGLRQHCAACEFEWSDLSPVIVQQYFMVFIRYRRKRPKVDASIFDSALSHTRRSDASEKKEEKSVSTFGRFR